jgi:murein DD-endopeptidase MepM/ murein hydrolase activator NlpD
LKIKKFLTILASVFISLALVVPVFAYTGYDVTFIQDAIDGTTRWVAPLKSGTSYLYSTITSKWNEQRSTGTSTGTSPHVGIDVSISTSNVVVAVASGALTKDTSSDGQSYNNIALRTPPSSKSVYCHYEHCASVYANGQYAQGDQVGVGGDYGSPGQPHLHFAAYDTSSLSTRKGYRNETLYRNAGNWNNGRNCDTFSVVSWVSNTTAQITYHRFKRWFDLAL